MATETKQGPFLLPLEDVMDQIREAMVATNERRTADYCAEWLEQAVCIPAEEV